MPHPNVTPADLFRLVLDHRRWWIYPLVVCAFVACAFSLVMPRKWKATQGVLIRPEAAGLSGDRLGKFSDLSEMKTLQETVLELARSKSVVSAALKNVGPASSWTSTANWPSAQDVEDFRDSMVMTPPGGAEFGKTEVFYLGVCDKSPERAAALVASLCQELEKRTQEIRSEQAQSMINELTQGVEQAEAALNVKLEELSVFERGVGANLNDLRALESPLGGSNQIAQDNLAIQAEIRSSATERRRTEKLMEVLEAAQADPQKLIATPSSLLTAQPAVDRLKQGLVDSQIRTARLLGKYSEQHPFVQDARLSEAKIREQLHTELATAVEGLNVELDLNKSREQSLRDQLQSNDEKLASLASHRSRYSTLVAEVENQTKLTEAARTRLADAQVHHAGAEHSSLLSRIDEVESGLRPLGPGRSTVVAAGALFGLVLGLGAIYVKFGPTPKTVHQLDASPRYAPPTTVDFGFSGTSVSHAVTSGSSGTTLHESLAAAGIPTESHATSY